MSNPFAALVDEDEKTQSGENEAVTSKQQSAVTEETKHLEDIFGFTLNEKRAIDYELVYLEDQANIFNGQPLDIEVLEHALADRLFMTKPADCLLSASKSCEDNKVESKAITYLFNCFKLNYYLNDKLIYEKVKKVILRNVLTAFSAPDLYPDQDVFIQLIDVLKEDYSIGLEFFREMHKAFLEDDGGVEEMREPFLGILKVIHTNLANMTIMTLQPVMFDIVKIFAEFEDLALLLLEYSTPKNNVGIEYANTLLGALFTISILPKTEQGAYEFFQNPLDPTSNVATENILYSNTQNSVCNVHSIFLTLLKCGPRVRNGVLSWFGNCLKSNVDRGKLWNVHTQDPLSAKVTVSDGFMLNMSAVLMKFCMPFCGPEQQAKMVKVDPTYCAVPEAECAAKSVHLTNLSQETCLVPCDDNNTIRNTSDTFNFMTECFYMGHKAFELGFKVVSEKLVRLNQEMAQIERAYNDAFSQSPNSPLLEQMKNRLATEMGRYLSLKAALSEPVFLEMLFHFMSSTSFWFTQVIVNNFPAKQKTFIPLVQRNVEFPLSNTIPETLKCIPEFLVENVVTYMVFLRRFNPKLFEMQGYIEMQPMLTFILIYMGSSARMKNPHLRARLAEALEALLPFHKDEPAGMNTLGGYQREMLFNQHEHRMEIVRNLLEVFVGIEMTGQSVQFEQKFNYRRPMYIVMDYLWEIQEHRDVFTTLAHEAESNMEAVTPPLFLRFINLLMNDAVFLLDESLSNMSKLKEMESRGNSTWDREFEQIAMIARFDNILGKDTIKTIERLTSRIQIVFTHSTMVDRVAAMLNYFLLNLVGPKQKNFKVKDSKKYSFDPAGTVLDICKIYVNLRESDDFCFAISQDGRSYSASLFGLAQDVLVRIGGGSLIGELQEFAAKVTRIAEEHQVTEDAIADAPDHFLDPIMSTLMTDPVILPSSKQTVDRSTIARHLLSDQTDPFNRSPLTMDQIVPNTALAEEITSWLNQKKASKSS